jgi:hypothetical protein
VDKLVTAQCVTDDPAPLLQAAGDVLALADVLRPNATAQPFTTEAEQERDRGQIQTAHNIQASQEADDIGYQEMAHVSIAAGGRQFRLDSDNPGEFFKILLAGNRVGGNTVAVRRAALLEAGGWHENVACQDWGLWLRLAHHGKRHARRSHYLACRRIHGQQLTTVHQSDGTYDRDQQYFQKLYSHRWPATPRKSTRPLT